MDEPIAPPYLSSVVSEIFLQAGTHDKRRIIFRPDSLDNEMPGTLDYGIDDLFCLLYLGFTCLQDVIRLLLLVIKARSRLLS